MVYRGKLSAGCSNCRKAKKRCDLARPECTRCVKLKQICTGYRDVSQLHIEDESAAVAFRVAKKSGAAHSFTPETRQPSEEYFDLEDLKHSLAYRRPISDYAHSSTDSEKHSDSTEWSSNSSDSSSDIIFTIRPRIDDVATTNFFGQFAASSYWDFLAVHMDREVKAPVLNFAIRACGMATLNNTVRIGTGREYATSMYAKSLTLLNSALRDPVKSIRDETLVAVVLLSYYENITCESPQSVKSWKIHIQGATQLLRLRGKQQFKTAIGRMLFREIRANILTNCIWTDSEPPSFLWEWNEDLQRAAVDPNPVVFHADRLIEHMMALARLRAAIAQDTVNEASASIDIARIDAQLIKWSTDAFAKGIIWQYTEQHVPDSPLIWNGLVYEHVLPLVATIWNSWRVVRILASRTQEVLCSRFEFSVAERNEQRSYFRKVRRQMTDEICAVISGLFGYTAAESERKPPGDFLSAYASIWPLFFAGTCALERLSIRDMGDPPGSVDAISTSVAAAQVAWIIGRMDHLADNIGIMWARAISVILRTEFKMHTDSVPGMASGYTLPWYDEIASKHHGPKNFTMTIMNDKRPIWVGRAVGQNARIG